MIGAWLLLACLGARAAETSGLPDAAVRRVAALEREISKERFGRVLLAETAGVPRRAVEGASVVAYRGAPPAVVFDLDRLASESEWDLELAYARALSYAAQGLSVELVESDEKAWADALAWAVEKAREDAAFSAKLRGALRARAADPEAPSVGELDRLSRYGARLLESVDSFCLAVESGRPWNKEAVSMTALSDFIDRYGPGYEAIAFQKGSPYARAGERRYPAALYEAALALKPGGGLAPIREALGPLETETLPELRRALERLK